jgi:hypothetical protein
MLTIRVLVSSRLRLLVILLIAAAGVIAAQVKSAPHSHFVLSSPDAGWQYVSQRNTRPTFSDARAEICRPHCNGAVCQREPKVSS